MLALPQTARHSCVWCTGIIWMETKFCIAWGESQSASNAATGCKLQPCLAGQACVLSDSEVTLSQVLSVLSKPVLLADHSWDIREWMVWSYSVLEQISAFCEFLSCFESSWYLPIRNKFLLALGVHVLLICYTCIYKTNIQCLHLQLESLWDPARGKNPLIKIMNKPTCALWWMFLSALSWKNMQSLKYLVSV